ncbi:eukaryotic translation initiation factor 5, putative [Theileria equi strain WA]|uniref:Eukaryotic translation initiation factor 5, putative n=1 Tax=Theileria equi strain WA TaxID=1537102 RepID=L1LDF9_THEEQ|nr:eukaryotic translation initiation factor 5, putative [Theileria equi strain WA]EKX73208.1 eukaryotic translation initiation factor 5, putative [Theileria equi strain WA]|eukprot:XP_004832660.1 eukaryotic translation initiation factor 5, putative [Theileria equi strain WA]
MSLVNIPRYRDDPNYRYKMPRIQSRIEGRGNGTKTNISNMGDIARALKRPPTYATKFFGCELGAMSKFEEAEEKALINGAHTEKALSLILDKFIELYVLCPQCQLPEIEVIVKRGALHSSCNACGHKGTLDMTHKAASYMIKNPIVSSSKMSKEREPKDAKEKEKKKKPSKKKEAGSPGNEDLVENEELTMESPEIAEVISRFHYFIYGGEKKSVDDLAQELHMLQLSQGFDNVCRFFVCLAAVFGTMVGARLDDSPSVDLSKLSLKDTDVSPEAGELPAAHDGRAPNPSSPKLSVDTFKDNIEVIKAATVYTISPKEIIGALEYFIFQCNPEEVSNYPYYAQAFYSDDVVEGSDFIRYYGKSSRYSGNLNAIFLKARETISPFIQWLQED